jgi:hypothetical protein
VGIIVDGDRDEVVKAVEGIDFTRWACEEVRPHIFRLPLFVVYVPYRNIYLDISKLDSKVADLDSKVVKLDYDLRIGFGLMAVGFAVTWLLSLLGARGPS